MWVVRMRSVLVFMARLVEGPDSSTHHSLSRSARASVGVVEEAVPDIDLVAHGGAASIRSVSRPTLTPRRAKHCGSWHRNIRRTPRVAHHRARGLSFSIHSSSPVFFKPSSNRSARTKRGGPLSERVQASQATASSGRTGGGRRRPYTPSRAQVRRAIVEQAKPILRNRPPEPIAGQLLEVHASRSGHCDVGAQGRTSRGARAAAPSLSVAIALRVSRITVAASSPALLTTAAAVNGLIYSFQGVMIWTRRPSGSRGVVKTVRLNGGGR